MGFDKVKLYAPPPPNPDRFLGHHQNKYLLSIHLGVCIEIYEVCPLLTCYDDKITLFLAHLTGVFFEFYL